MGEPTEKMFTLGELECPMTDCNFAEIVKVRDVLVGKSLGDLAVYTLVKCSQCNAEFVVMGILTEDEEDCGE